MEIDDFLASSFFDALEIKFDILGTGSHIFDKIFLDKNGNIEDDISVLKTRGKDFFDEDIFNSVYSNIIDSIGSDLLPSINKIIDHLINKYLIYNYSDSKKQVLIDFINSSDKVLIKDLFINDYNFGLEIITSYYYCLTNDTKYIQNRREILKANQSYTLIKWLEKDILNMNNILRNIIGDIYNHYISCGCDDISALNMTWLYFTQNIDPLHVLDNLGVQGVERLICNRYLLQLIIADVYEDVCNKTILDSNNYEDKLANIIPVIAATFNIIRIPTSERARNMILKHFILLQDEKQKKKENRIKTYEDNRIICLKKLNPMYELDEYYNI